MIIIKIFLIIFLIKTNHADFIQQFRPFTPITVPQPPPCPLQQQQTMSMQPNVENVKASGNSSEINFVLPFMDIDVEVERSAYVLQDIIQGDIFIVHGHELYQVFLGRQEKRLSLMGYLEGSVRSVEPVAAEIISWQGHLILVVALDDSLEIYQIRRDLLKSRAELLKDPRATPDTAPVFATSQQLTLSGKFQNLFVVSTAENQIIMIAAVKFSKLYGKIRTFKWQTNAFKQLEELTVPALSVVNVIGSDSKYLLIGKVIKRLSKTILTIYAIDPETLRLQNKQTVTVDSLGVHSFTFQKQNLIIACSSKQSQCKAYLQMPDGHFAVFKQRSAQEFTFDRLSVTSRFIVASRQNRIMVFTDHHLDCYGSFTSDLMDIAKLMGYHGEEDGEDYVLLIHKTPFRLLMRTVEMEFATKERMSRATRKGVVPLLTRHKQFVSGMVKRFRSFLPRRRQTFFERMFNPQPVERESNIFEKFIDIINPRPKKPEPKDPMTEMFQRMMNVMEPRSRQQQSIDLTSDYFQRMLDVGLSNERQAQPAFTDIFQTVGDMMSPRTTAVRSKKSLTLNSGKVGKIQISNRFLRSPKQVLQKISEVRQMYQVGPREKRSDNKGPYNIALELRNQVKVKKLKVKNLLYDGDVIEGFSYNRTSEPRPILSIKSKLRTELLNSSEIIVPPSMRDTREFPPDLYSDLTPSIRAKHLKVVSVNGLPWSEFYEGLFLRNHNSTITGRLVLQSQVDVEHLNTSILNELTVEKLFNLRQYQVVNSHLVMSGFFVHDLKAESVNGLKFEEDIVFSGREAYVETPVTMHHLSISGDLIVADKKIERFSQNPDEMDFKQFYTNKVIINGTLVLNNVRRDKDNGTKIEIGDEEFQGEDIKQKYLLKDENQHFEFPVAFDNAKVVAPTLETQYLNGHPTEGHMLTDGVNNTKPLLIVFMKAEVPGNVICRDYKSKIAEINENIIRQGDVVNVTGKKVFEAPLATDELQATMLAQLPVSDLIFKPELIGPLQFRDSKSFEKIIVRNPVFVEKGIDAMYLNNLPLEDLLNYDYHMDHIYVPHRLLTSNIVFHKINGIPFDDFFTKLNVHGNQLILRKNLIVEGNVVFAEPLEVEHINDLEWNKYLGNLARNNENSVIEGNVCFYGDLTVTQELQAAVVNNYNLEDIFKNILMKSKPQLITGQYTFGNLKASNLDVLSINDKPINEFIDLSKNYTEFEGDVIVPHVTVKGNLKGILDQPLHSQDLAAKAKLLTSKSWRNLKVLKNISWNKNQTSINTQLELLKYLYRNAVKSNQNQIITGNVKLVRPVIKQMRTRLQFPADLDLNFIEKDALSKSGIFQQKIQGAKTFLNPIYMNKLEAQKDIRTPFVNNIDIMLFNNSLYRLSSDTTLAGPLTFQKPLTVGHLSVKGFINGLNASLIYQIKNITVLPPVSINQLFIDNNVQLKNINYMNLEYFLDNRVTLNGPALEVFGFLTFENLIIRNAALLQTINNIHIDNMVFKHSPFLQTITGRKIVKDSLELAGPAHVMRLNDKDLMETYRNTLFTNRNYEFDKLVIDSVTFEQGLNVMSGGGGGGVAMKQRSFDGIGEVAEGEEQDFKQFLINVNQTLSTNSGKILYLDYNLNTRVKWQKPDNISIDKIVLKENSRISCCEKEFLKISYSKLNQEIYLENITSNRLSAFVDNVAVKTENYCKFKYRKVKSKISIAAANLLKVFGMKRFVESIHVLVNAHRHRQQFVILHVLDLPSLRRNEARIFKIDEKNNSIEDWQSLTQNIGEKLKVLKMSTANVLITNGHVDKHPALTVYHFNETSEKFKLQQIIDGDYDIIEMVELHNGTYQQLIISCHKCKRIFIYEYTPQEPEKYQLFQLLSMTTTIDKLFMFSIQNDNYMLIVAESDASYFYLYKYSYIQGWLHITYGYYPNLHMSVPLYEQWNGENHFDLSDNSDSKPLMILCSLENCHLVNAIVQK